MRIQAPESTHSEAGGPADLPETKAFLYPGVADRHARSSSLWIATRYKTPHETSWLPSGSTRHGTSLSGPSCIDVMSALAYDNRYTARQQNAEHTSEEMCAECAARRSPRSVTTRRRS